jgi:hypothetical protein
MEPTSDLYYQLITRRIEMLRLLAAALRQSQKAVTARDLDGIYQGTLQQENLCAGIRFLDQEIKTAKNSSGPGAQRTSQEIGLIEDLLTAESEVRYLNRVQAGLLRRSRRSVNVLVNFLANYLGTYEACGNRAQSSFPIGVGV